MADSHLLRCHGRLSQPRQLRNVGNLKRQYLDGQASIFDQPTLKQKLLARSVVLEGRGGGSDGGEAWKKDITNATTEVFATVNNF